MTLYGLYGFTHGGASVLTVMSPAESSAVQKAVRPDADVILYATMGGLPRYHEKRAGALDRMVERNGIIVLSKAEWDRHKAVLGDAIYD